MRIPIYQADAFTDKLFGGNPAAVCPLTEWLPDPLMQQIALENNLSETAFLVPEKDAWHIRWFTPSTEVNLCGHATLASAHILFNELGFAGNTLTFHSKSGPLTVSRAPEQQLELDFPANPPGAVSAIPTGLLEGLGISQGKVFTTSFDYLVVVDTQHEIEQLNPNYTSLAKVPCRGVIVTSPGDTTDFVSRCFYPQSGINEDPVTGSAHTIMVPYWSMQLGKNRLSATQLSARRGRLDCELRGDRVLMRGRAITYLTGEIRV